MEYYDKYIKYKTKYIALKNELALSGGTKEPKKKVSPKLPKKKNNGRKTTYEYTTTCKESS